MTRTAGRLTVALLLAVFILLALAALAAPVFAARLPETTQPLNRAGPRISVPETISIWSFSMGFALDGIFVFGLSLIAAQSLPQGAVIAAGAAMALRYVSEIVLSTPGGLLAQRIGPRRLLIVLSLATSASLAFIGVHSLLVWGAIIVTVILRALLQPLPGPVVAMAYPGPERVQALARQATWRDIGAGTGPLAAGVLMPLLPALAVFAGAGGLLALSTALLMRERATPRDVTGT